MCNSILQKASDLEDTREVTLTASIYDLYLDKVRDLGYGMSLTDADMVKSSNVKEKKGHDDDKPGPNNMEIVCDGSTNVNISQYGLNSIVKNGTIVPIKDSKDIGRLLDHAFTYKERLALKSIDAISENRAHIIVNLCLKMIDKENPNFPAVNSLVQFVRLGGSEKISKSLTGNTGQKYQENIIVNADYANLQRIVYGLYTGQKSIPYEGSK